MTYPQPSTRQSGPPPTPWPRIAMWLAFAAAFVGVTIALIVLGVIATRDDTTATTATSTTGLTTSASTSTSGSSTPTSVTTGDTSSSSTISTTASTSTSSTTSTEPSTTRTTTFDQLDSAVWPDPAAATSFADPVEVAASFARDYLVLAETATGSFQQGDSRSGEVEIRSNSGDLITTALVRQLGPGDNWFVIGSVSAHIILDQPEVLAVVENPLLVSGQAEIAVDGQLSVELRVHGENQPLVTDSTPLDAERPTPYRFSLDWTSDAAWAQVVVVAEPSDPGSPIGIQVISVRLR